MQGLAKICKVWISDLADQKGESAESREIAPSRTLTLVGLV
jgi:hypothetical protein